MVEQSFDNSELYHHGILGQKWGVRRFQNPDGSLTPEGRERYSSDNKERSVVSRVKQGAHDLAVKRAVKTGKGLSVLSDDELRDALNRRNTELNYKRTMDSLNPKKVHKGRQILADALERTARGALYKASDKLVGKMFNDSDDELEDEVRRQSNLARLRSLKEESESFEAEKGLREYGRRKREADAKFDEEMREINQETARLDAKMNNLKKRYESGQTENLANVAIGLNQAMKAHLDEAFQLYGELANDDPAEAEAFMNDLLGKMKEYYSAMAPFSGKKKGDK